MEVRGIACSVIAIEKNSRSLEISILVKILIALGKSDYYEVD